MAKRRKQKLTPEECRARHLVNVAREQARVEAEARERADALVAEAARLAAVAEEGRRAAAERRVSGALTPVEAARRLAIPVADLRIAIKSGAVPTRPDGSLLASVVGSLDLAEIERVVRDADPFKTLKAAEYVGVEPETIRKAVKTEVLTPSDYGAWRFGSYFIFRRRDLDAARGALVELDRVRLDRRTKRGAAAAARAEVAAATRREIAARIEVSLPTRTRTPRIVAHLGPTNSGKTHAALVRLCELGAGTYAAPLRMMAREVYERLSMTMGPEQVGLVTGEERINEHAPLIACTTEMVPSVTPALVLDEAHWLADRDRGPAWTSAMLGVACDELHLVGSTDVGPLLAATGLPIEVRRYERFTPLRWIGPVSMKQLAPATIVVAFGRKAVYALARDIEVHRPGRVGVLYGAMPIEERRRQIAAFIEGQTDVLVATDVLGHGVNLPARTVLFAESTKFDGRVRRPLEPWEVAQIAGRAGRYGYHDAGYVGLLTGHVWANPSSAVIEAGLVPRKSAPDGTPVFRIISWAQLGPSRSMFIGFPPTVWPIVLELWDGRARALANEHRYLEVADLGPTRRRMAAIGPELLANLDPDDAWSLAHAPLDPDETESGTVAAWLLHASAVAVAVATGHRRMPPGGTSIAIDMLPPDLTGADLEQAEHLAERLVFLRWFALHWPGAGEMTMPEIERAERAVLDLIRVLVDQAIRTNRFGVCQACGQPSAPWFSSCERCWHDSHPRRYGWDGEDDDEGGRFDQFGRRRW